MNPRTKAYIKYIGIYLIIGIIVGIAMSFLTNYLVVIGWSPPERPPFVVWPIFFGLFGGFFGAVKAKIELL